MQIEIYKEEHQLAWDEFVKASKNGTFLLLRDYMEYHSDRFSDNSLIFFDETNKIIALLPANLHNKILYSHQGLTYGGFVTSVDMTQPRMLTLFDCLNSYLIEHGIEELIYKTIPSIYHRCPADEDHYALFLCNAELYRRDILTVISPQEKIDFQSRRVRQIKKAQKSGLTIIQDKNYSAFWHILSQNLQAKHKVSPVHNLEEIILLAGKFPENIKLHCCHENETMLAGVVVYETSYACHFQYIAASDEGKLMGALDFLFASLITDIYRHKKYIDFGISNENNGRHLNIGLIDYKEGFGGRSIKHDYYKIKPLRNKISFVTAD